MNTKKVFVQDELFQEFCNRFPFEETKDQLQAINDVVEDLSTFTKVDLLFDMNTRTYHPEEEDYNILNTSNFKIHKR